MTKVCCTCGTVYHLPDDNETKEYFEMTNEMYCDYCDNHRPMKDLEEEKMKITTLDYYWSSPWTVLVIQEKTDTTVKVIRLAETMIEDETYNIIGSPIECELIDGHYFTYLDDDHEDSPIEFNLFDFYNDDAITLTINED